ncbi:MAG: UPF0182 family protein [Candidatus Bathyarchaeia archaeon]
MMGYPPEGYEERYEEAYQPPSRRRRWPRWIVIAILAVILGAALSRSALTFWLNIEEFGGLYLKPFYLSLYGGLILAAAALFRVDFARRRSLTWWMISLIVRVFKGGPLMDRRSLSFSSFTLSPHKFLAWQVTKVLLAVPSFSSLSFGLAASNMELSVNPGIIATLAGLPFKTPPFDPSYAHGNVIPLIPGLTLLLGPILGALSVRLIVLVGLTELVRVFTPSRDEVLLEDAPAKIGWRVAVVEALIGLALLWTAFTRFTPSYIDYNTRYIIGGAIGGGVLYLILALNDRVKNVGRPIGFFKARRVAARILPLLLIGLILGSIILVNNSIADARKVEWLGPYTAQEIAVNRYLANLDSVYEAPYNFSLRKPSQEAVASIISSNRELMRTVRLWDWEAAYTKLKPEIGLIPYIDFQDSDIIRFNNTLYWSASMKPILPEAVRPEDRWYAMHFYYTHVPNGFFLLNAHEGVVVNSTSFFKQRRIYYGEGGLFEETWAAYPLNRVRSDELGGFLYDGKGGIDVYPPVSWLFEFNFLLAYRDQPIHIIRYRDIYTRMRMLFPYFVYDFNGGRLDIYPVTDGENTFFAVPLIVRLDTTNVPWSRGNPYMRLAGYALIDIYNGDTKLYIIGDDFYSQLIKREYAGYVEDKLPEWFWEQARYPEELLEWQVDMYNYYHVKDPATFIVGKEFFEVPEGVDTYYIIAQPPGLGEPEFLGVLPLELRGAKGRNLAGYMIARNRGPHLGELVFYRVPLESETKLLGPTGALEALEKNPSFAQLKTLLRTPRIGNIILYRVGEYDVYFIPVYTSTAGGVVTEIGVIACVGAAFTGEYYVGLGSTPEEAFASFLAQLTGTERKEEPTKPEKTLQDLIREANEHLENFMSLWSKGDFEGAGRELRKFMDLWREIAERMSGEG